MPLTPDIQMVSIDDHLIEHPRVWTDRVPAKFADRMPRVVEVEEEFVHSMGGAMTALVRKGSQVWHFEDLIVPNVGLSAVAGTPLRERNQDPLRFEDMRPGAYDPIARLPDMDEDGVWVNAPFPTFPGFAGNKFVLAQDKELAEHCVRAYNDFIIEEWCASAPDRYIPLVILPLWDMDLTVAEIERTAAMGAKGICFPDNPTPIGLPSFHTGAWDRVFKAATDAEQPLCMHFGGSRVVPYVSPGAHQAATTVQFGITLLGSMTELVFSNALHDNPDLKIVYAEGGIGWMPYAMQRIDQVWESQRYYDIEPRLNADVRPSDLIRTHVWSCFIDDPLGVDQRDLIGVDRLLWESDYPHSDSLWPNSRSNAEKVFADVPTAVVRRIVETNARELFNFPR